MLSPAALAVLGILMWTAWTAAAARHELWLAALGSPAAGHALFVLDWIIMSVAMMLPTSLPLFRDLARLARGSGGRRIAVAAVAIVAVWAAFGMGLRVIAVGLQLPARVGEAAISAVALGGGGAYLLSPFATRCVRACRTPYGFIARRWRGSTGQLRAAALIGLDYGWSCVGCCWPLMLAMALFAMQSPIWMLTATLFMLWHKSTVRSEIILQIIGAAMMLAAVLVSTGHLALALDPMVITADHWCGLAGW